MRGVSVGVVTDGIIEDNDDVHTGSSIHTVLQTTNS